MNYGITAQGFIIKPYDVILAELTSDAQSDEYFGSDVDLSDDSPLGVEIKLKANAIYKQWQLAEDVYYSFWLSTAEGVSLDRVTKLGFVKRQAAAYASVNLIFKGLAGTVIPAKTQASTAQNIVFETQIESIISSEGEVAVLSRCTERGTSGLVASGMITRIVNPIAGVDSVNNLSPSTGGRPIESDAELVDRYEALPSATGSSVPAIEAALNELDSVVTARVFENTNNLADDNGLPAGMIEAVIEGGSDADIAEVLYNKKPAGQPLYGSQTVSIIDSHGIQRNINFSRPESINVYITYEIKTNISWSNENLIQIKRNAVKYVGGVDDNMIEYKGVGVSQSVFSWKLLAAQSALTGIEEMAVKLGKNLSPTHSDNLDFLTRERAVTDTSMINVVLI